MGDPPQINVRMEARMTPERKDRVGDYKIEEIYWARSYVCYVNNQLSAESFDETTARLRRGEKPNLRKVKTER